MYGDIPGQGRPQGTGEAHARQVDRPTRLGWRRALMQHPKGLEAPSWLWTSVVNLAATHESAYLDYCRRFPTAVAYAASAG
jgi:uncharacterized protein (DUF2252 family)